MHLSAFEVYQHKLESMQNNSVISFMMTFGAGAKYESKVPHFNIIDSVHSNSYHIKLT